ncbi:MAG: hypothetical protein ACJAXM_000876 [Arenicella sp.]|jgi:hypothetical protein
MKNSVGVVTESNPNIGFQVINSVVKGVEANLSLIDFFEHSERSLFEKITLITSASIPLRIFSILTRLDI